jgi:hypothetical protein
MLVQAFVSLGVVTQLSVGGGDNLTPPERGPAPGLSWSGLDGIGQRALGAVVSIADGGERSCLALVRGLQDSLRVVDLVFALASREGTEGSAAPPAVTAEAVLALATEVSVRAANSDEAEGVWFSPLMLARAGVFLLGFAAAAFCGKKRWTRPSPGRPALKTVVTE